MVVFVALLFAWAAREPREPGLKLSVLQGVPPREIFQNLYSGGPNLSEHKVLYRVSQDYEYVVKSLDKELREDRGWSVRPIRAMAPSVLYTEGDRSDGTRGWTVLVTAMHASERLPNGGYKVRRVKGKTGITVRNPQQRASPLARALHAVSTKLGLRR